MSNLTAIRLRKKQDTNINANIINEVNVFSVILCFAVMMIHLTSSPVTYMEDKLKLEYYIVFALNRLLSFAVPGFLFLSGFKLQCKYKDRKMDVKKFYVGRIKKIYVPYLIACLIYFITYLMMKYAEFNVMNLLYQILFGNISAHFYYIVIAMQFYLIFPLLIKIFQKNKWITLGLSIIATIMFQQFMIFDMSDRFFLSYIFYFVLGMFFADNYDLCKKEMLNKTFVIPTVLSFILLSIYHCKYSYLTMMGAYWYKAAKAVNILYVFLALMCVYYVAVFISNLPKKITDVIENVSKYSFYIYLYHILLMQLFEVFILSHFDLTIKAKFIYSTILLYGLAILVPYFIERMKKLRRLTL